MRQASAFVGSKLSAAAAVLAPSNAAMAVSVAPGESTTTRDGPDFVMPTGELLAERSFPLTLNFAIPEGTVADPAPGTTGTLTSSVRRGTSGSGLVFVYDLRLEADTEYADEFARLTVGSFAGFSTDVTGDIGPFPGFEISRSADGATVVATKGDGVGGNVILAIETDAAEFNDQGTAEFRADAEFVLTDPNDPTGGPGQVGLDATVNVSGVFQPTADDPGPQPNPIPLPPAAWAAIATMGGFGAVKRLRRGR